MDPKENTTPAVPERPLTRREVRERERAQQEAQQRMLTPQRRTYTPPPSAFPRAAAASAPTAGPQTSTRPTPTGPSTAVPPTGATPAVPRVPSTPAAPNAAEAGEAGSPLGRPAAGAQRARHDGLRPRRAASSFESALPAGGPAQPGGDASPTAASMGWGSYPSSSGPEAAHPSAALDDARSLPAPVPASSPATAFMPAVGQTEPADAPAARSAAVPAAEAPATRPVGRVPAPAPEAGDRRHIFPLAAQRYSSSAAVADPVAVDDLDDAYEEPLHTGPLRTEAFHHVDHGLHEGYHPADPHHDHAHDGLHEVFGEPVTAPAPKRRSRKLRVILGLGLAIALFVGAALVGVQFLRPILGLDRVSDYPGPGSGEVVVNVAAGSGAAAVADSLVKQGIVADAKTFLKEFSATGASLHPGDFTFKKEMRAKDAAEILAGTSGEKVLYIALNAGLRVGESLDAIAAGASVDRKELDALNAQPAQFGLPAQAKSLEGYLAPGEYRFPVGTSAKDIVAKLVTTTLDALTSAGVTDPAKQYEVLTVASIVQAEGGRADYGNVAGAVYNRLKPNPETGGLIQSDATVTYGLGRKSYHITEEEKADASNPYNTYSHTGLPPGPIGSPGTTAIKAAASPTPNDYLYWVTVNLDTGETKFSKTYAEHLGYA